jgi:hypothetical protein
LEVALDDVDRDIDTSRDSWRGFDEWAREDVTGKSTGGGVG